MPYQIVKLFIYVSSIGITMYSLSCFKFEEYIKVNKLKEFYIFYFIISIVIGYLLGSFMLEFMNIRL